ncbi:unnamed protein product [Peronospora belbahrii]|uniref:Kazal-like domain-containing protein n=1 Tax=Peronospora belbahrii TaxID=622444 RepID=A0AAU9KTC9_9STRA|nr:unnamed protein product [Peronospora belbahrii]CAH0516613.1 unnamed protein product [Peronospora belbahrii]
MMKVLVVPVIAALSAFSISIEALERDKQLEVVATVHSNYHLLTRYDDEAKDRLEIKCFDNFTLDDNPICASNGQMYTNLSMFNYRKCMLKIQEGTELEMKDVEFCKSQIREELEHVE